MVKSNQPIYSQGELLEMKSGSRNAISDGLSRIIIDSMDWKQPCLEKLYTVDELLRKFYKLKA